MGVEGVSLCCLRLATAVYLRPGNVVGAKYPGAVQTVFQGRPGKGPSLQAQEVAEASILDKRTAVEI